MVRALYTPEPSHEEAAHWGLTVEEASGPPVDIWPENLQSHNVFVVMLDQWIMGFNGPVGLNYGSLPEVWRRTKTPHADRDRIFDDLRVMADTALGIIRAQQKKG